MLFGRRRRHTRVVRVTGVQTWGLPMEGGRGGGRGREIIITMMILTTLTCFRGCYLLCGTRELDH